MFRSLNYFSPPYIHLRQISPLTLLASRLQAPRYSIIFFFLKKTAVEPTDQRNNLVTLFKLQWNSPSFPLWLIKALWSNSGMQRWRSAAFSTQCTSSRGKWTWALWERRWRHPRPAFCCVLANSADIIKSADKGADEAGYQWWHGCPHRLHHPPLAYYIGSSPPTFTWEWNRTLIVQR